MPESIITTQFALTKNINSVCVHGLVNSTENNTICSIIVH